MMFEKIPRKPVAAALAILAGGIGLAGCGSKTKEGTWKVAVECPPAAKEVHVENLDQKRKLGEMANTGGASFGVTCQEGPAATAPVGFELVSGEGAKVHQTGDVTGTITIDYTYETGVSGLTVGDSPVIEFGAVSEKVPAEVDMSGIKNIEAVNVGN